MTGLGEPPFWSYQVEAQAVRTVTLLDLWLVRTEDIGVVVYSADADTAAALEIPLKGAPDGEFKRGVAWFGRYCVPGLERYVEWRGPYKTHDEAFDSLDTEYGSHCHSWGDVVKKVVADRIVKRSDHYGWCDGHIEPVFHSLISRKN